MVADRPAQGSGAKGGSVRAGCTAGSSSLLPAENTSTLVRCMQAATCLPQANVGTVQVLLQRVARCLLLRGTNSKMEGDVKHGAQPNCGVTTGDLNSGALQGKKFG